MHVSAKADYGMRALLELAAAYEVNPHRLVKGEAIATAQGIPVKFLEGILRQLRQSGIVASMRGAEGGYRLDRDPKDVSIADVVRALDGPLAAVRGQRPEDLDYTGASEHLREVWIAVRASMRHWSPVSSKIWIRPSGRRVSVTRWRRDPVRSKYSSATDCCSSSRR